MYELYTHRCSTVNTPRCLLGYYASDILEYMNLSDRIKAAREFAKLTQIELSKKSSLPQQTISKLELGLQEETAGIVRIALACGVNPVWLDSGVGLMIQEQETKVESETERDVLKMVRENPELIRLLKVATPLKDYQIDVAVQTSIALAKQKEPPKNNGTQ